MCSYGIKVASALYDAEIELYRFSHKPLTGYKLVIIYNLYLKACGSVVG
jgi:hypothetical protein